MRLQRPLLQIVTYQRTASSLSPPWSLWCPVSEFFTLFRLWKPLRNCNISRNPIPVFEFATQPQYKKGEGGTMWIVESLVCLLANKTATELHCRFNQLINCTFWVLICRCDGWGCFDEHINLKSGIMGDGCHLRSASASSTFLYLIFVIVYQGNQFTQANEWQR